MTRAGPFHVRSRDSFTVSIAYGGQSIHVGLQDLPALRRLLEKLEGRNRGPLPADQIECEVCGKRSPHPAPGSGGTWRCAKPACTFGKPGKPAKPTKGKPKRKRGGR